jgi:hypothetical protein
MTTKTQQLGNIILGTIKDGRTVYDAATVKHQNPRSDWMPGILSLLPPVTDGIFSLASGSLTILGCRDAQGVLSNHSFVLLYYVDVLGLHSEDSE